jgi:hypothetical protein
MGAGLGFKAAAVAAALLLQDEAESQLYTHGEAERNVFEKRAGDTALPSIIVPDSGKCEAGSKRRKKWLT